MKPNFNNIVFKNVSTSYQNHNKLDNNNITLQTKPYQTHNKFVTTSIKIIIQSYNNHIQSKFKSLQSRSKI